MYMQEAVDALPHCGGCEVSYYEPDAAARKAATGDGEVGLPQRR
jgi:hypothetical protein